MGKPKANDFEAGTFAFDENLADLSRGLRAWNEPTIEVVDILRGEKDPALLDQLPKHARFLVTSDDRMTKFREEVEAIGRNKVGVFVVPNQINRCDRIRLMVKAWSSIKMHAAKTAPPFIADVSAAGNVKPRVWRG